jgi:hypothetical protein
MKGVPRFSSFRPPPSPAAVTGSEREDGSRSRHRQRADHESPLGIRRRRRSRNRRRQEARTEERGVGESHKQREVGGETIETNVDYVVDTQGDRDITRYGTYQYDVPAYRRNGSGLVVGAPGRRISLESRFESALVLQGDAGSAPKPLSATTLPALTMSHPLRIHPDAARGTPDNTRAREHLQDFISTEAPSQPGLTASASHLEADEQPYRSIRVLTKSEEEATTEDSEGNKITQDTAEAEVLQRHAKLNSEVESHPQDIGAWLCLAEHQELVITGARYDGRALNYAEQQLVAKAKLSVYERAIQKNPENPKLDHLLLGRMEEGAKVWDPAKLTNEWGEVLAWHPEFISLWVEYLDYCQTDYVHFNFDKCFQAYIYCLNLNSHVGFGQHKNQVRSYLLLRLTLFLRESGHMELAVGFWQAVLEFTCFRPAHLMDQNQALEEFDKFWAQENARIGERGWTGWDSGESSLRADADDFDYKLEAGLPELFKSWAIAERERITKNRMPTHTYDEANEDEAYRVVLRIDCKQVLPYFWDFIDNFSPLISAFLYFCHLPTLTVSHNIRNTRLWSGDNFLRNEYMDDSQNTIADWINFQKYAETTTIQPFAFPHQNFIHTTDTLFADPNRWFSSLSKWAATTSHESSVVNPDFVLRVLYALVDNFEDKELAEYAIAVTFARDSALGKTYGKFVLKKRPSHLRLYNAVALMYWRTGDHDFAHTIWSNALAMSQDFQPQELIDSALLWNSWIWEMLHSGQYCRASYLLHAMSFKRVHMLSYITADETELNPTTFLRLQKFLFSAQQNAFALENSQAYSAYTDCFAIALFLMGETLESVVQVYDDAVASLNEMREDVKVFAGELLHQARARIIHLWVETKRGQFKPAEIRQQFLQSMQWWPHNTIFLSLFKWNDARLNLMHRTRDIFEVTTGRDPNSANAPAEIHRVPITTHLFSIYIEMGRPVVLGSTAHSIRAAFERAIGDATISMGRTPAQKHAFELTSSTSAKNSLTLWRLYILYELYAQYNVPRAREIFLRAVRSCPWSKELYMLAFEHLRADLTAALPRCCVTPKGQANPPGFDSSELRALYSEMMRRGHRIHHHVEDFWEGGEMPYDISRAL